ncbi:G-protein coupled receptor 151 protein-like [Rhineura floridana]|uniref:G-protein coupled receptor 151 protein-like n=1 Tax=Rhineura floridana TaxID=261503 RepID=UPI002AC86CC3|nr:G-protein coupled receptor 151 protein-like [Rhineura floridana]
MPEREESARSLAQSPATQKARRGALSRPSLWGRDAFRGKRQRYHGQRTRGFLVSRLARACLICALCPGLAAEESLSTMNSSEAVFFAGGGAESPVALLPWFLAGVCLVSLAGNLLLLVVLVHQLRRGATCAANALVLNLCSADLLLGVYCLPTRIIAYSRRSWVLDGFVCKTADWLLHGCLVAKSLTWAAVGHARRKQVASSSSSSPQCLSLSWPRLAGLLAAAWLAALLLPLPHLLFARLEVGGAGSELLSCVFRSPPYASNFMAVFSKVYPLVACLAPAGFAGSCYWRSLRGQRGRRNRLARPSSPQSKRATWVLLGLTLLFQATWLPEWVVWLWERHSQGSPWPPPALVFAAEALVFLDGSLSPAVFLAASGDLRDGLRSLWKKLSCSEGGVEEEGAGRPAGAKPGGEVQEDRDGAAAAVEKVLPDVEHFWKDRRNTSAGEESDPIPWEHQSEP